MQSSLLEFKRVSLREVLECLGSFEVPPVNWMYVLLASKVYKETIGPDPPLHYTVILYSTVQYWMPCTDLIFKQYLSIQVAKQHMQLLYNKTVICKFPYSIKQVENINPYWLRYTKHLDFNSSLFLSAFDLMTSDNFRKVTITLNYKLMHRKTLLASPTN